MIESNYQIYSRKVIIATGGLSYSKTGSTGDGYIFAKSFGHTIINPLPGLVPLITGEKFVKKLSGLSVKDIEIKYKSENSCKARGDLIFTHFGISGPAVLNFSSELASIISNEKKLNIQIDFLPDLRNEEIENIFLDTIRKHPHKSSISLFDFLLPKSLIAVIFEQNKLNPEIKLKILDKNTRKKIISIVKSFPLTLIGSLPIESATITKGGVSTQEINSKTMESKIQKGLYFAGEVIDVDGKCGGYNLQICWSTGYLAGLAASTNPKIF